MKPVLYPSQETAFGSNGLGILTDAASCVIIEERNGAFELEMTYYIRKSPPGASSWQSLTRWMTRSHSGCTASPSRWAVW